LDWAKDPGDAAILRQAREAGRILVTLDRDFGALAVRDGVPHVGIVRLVAVSARAQASLVVAALLRHGEDLARGGIVTVHRDRMRLRPP